MDVRLSVEQQALRDSARRVLARLGPSTVGALDDVERAGKLDAAVEASGWRGLRVPGADGEPLGSGVEAALVAEELGRGLADTPFLGPTLATELRRLAGAPAPPELETVALSRDLGELATVDTGPGGMGAVDSGSVDRGTVDMGPAGCTAIDSRGVGFALVLLTAEGGRALGRVALQPPGADVDLTRGTARPHPGTPCTPLGEGRALGEADLTRLTALGLTLTSADLVGVMAGAVRLASEYAADRHQFGTPVGSFQAVQHLLADAFVATEGARSATLHAAWAVDALPPPEALVSGAVAKAYSSRAALSVCEAAIQVHGGIGHTWECLAHLYLRRALLSIDLFGGAARNVDRVLAGRGIGSGVGLR